MKPGTFLKVEAKIFLIGNPFFTEAITKAGLFVPGHTFQTSLLLSVVTLKVQHVSVKVSHRVSLGKTF
jgi:hypothetical protein